ncbi:MAG: hypothetical protein ACLTBV_12245 [Enterocloster bolteae]
MWAWHAREHGGENWYSDRMRKLGLQITRIKKRRGKHTRAGKSKGRAMMYLDQEISRIIG